MTMFTTFIEGRDATDVLSTEVTTGLWSPDETGSLNAVFTSSVQRAVSGEYYYDLYHLNPNVASNNAEVQFAVAYGHINGGGAPTTTYDPFTTLPTKVVYSQYRNILLASGSKFKFGSIESDDIYVVNISRARMKQALDPGNWQLALSGSNGIHTFIDNFGNSTSIAGNVIASNAYDIRSGSITGNTVVYAGDTVYGTVFPDYGAIILYPAAISASVGFSGSNSNTNNAVTLMAGNVPFTPYTGSDATTFQYQHEGLYRSISGSMAAGRGFFARSVEKVASKNYSVYLDYKSYNYTNNPSYYTVSATGTQEVISTFADNPLTYITTIGLYTDDNELVAVAKLSRPLQKSKDKSALIRVRLDY